MLRNFRTIIGLSVICFINLIPLLFTGDAMNEQKVDIYLFHDRLRYPENIAFDISEIFSITFFIYLIWRLVPLRSHKRYVFCFLLSSIFSIIGYFLFYSRYASLILIPILIGMIIYVYRTYDYEKRNNAR